MTDDQHRIGRRTAAQLVIAEALERWDARPADQRPEPLAVGAWVLDQLQNHHGWRPPLDPAEVPPLRPSNATTDGPGYAEFQAARAKLGRKP